MHENTYASTPTQTLFLFLFLSLHLYTHTQSYTVPLPQTTNCTSSESQGPPGGSCILCFPDPTSHYKKNISFTDSVRVFNFTIDCLVSRGNSNRRASQTISDYMDEESQATLKVDI